MQTLLAKQPSSQVERLRFAECAIPVSHTARCVGANSGIGIETVRALAQNGARVILTSRSLAAGGTVVESLQRSPLKVGEHQRVHFF